MGVCVAVLLRVLGWAPRRAGSLFRGRFWKISRELLPSTDSLGVTVGWMDQKKKSKSAASNLAAGKTFLDVLQPANGF